jgi:hypothetical protein
MKKALLLMTAVAAAVLAAALPAIAGAAPARSPIGMISLAEGKATVESGGQSREALAGEELFEGDAVVTGPGAKVKVLFRDDSLVTIAADTRLEVSAYMVDPASKLRKSVLTVAKGKVLSLVSRVFANPSSMFEVRTKTAVAGVRGTRFIVESGDAGDRVATLEGTVAVRKTGAAGEVSVGAGSYTEVREAVGAAVAMSDDLKARISGDLQKIDKTPSYAMNLGTLSSKDLIGGAAGVDDGLPGGQTNGRVAKSIRGPGGGTSSEAGTGEKGGEAAAGGGTAGTGGTSPVTGDPGAFDSPGSKTTGTGNGAGGGGGQTGTIGMTNVTVTISLPTVPRLLKRR